MVIQDGFDSAESNFLQIPYSLGYKMAVHMRQSPLRVFSFQESICMKHIYFTCDYKVTLLLQIRNEEKILILCVDEHSIQFVLLLLYKFVNYNVIITVEKTIRTVKTHFPKK